MKEHWAPIPDFPGYVHCADALAAERHQHREGHGACEQEDYFCKQQYCKNILWKYEVQLIYLFFILKQGIWFWTDL